MRVLAAGRLKGLAVSALVAGSVACVANDSGRERQPPTSSVPAAGGSSRAGPAPAADARPRVVVLGDSLTAGLGLAVEDAYPSLLQRRLDDGGWRYRVANAGVSGDTSAGGLARLDLALEGDVRVLIVALGGNDALRGLPPDELRRNLSSIIERAQQRGVAVILAGMEAPPNFGPAYTAAFRAVYRSVAMRYQVAFIPFLLEGVAGVERLNQRDGIHPTAEGDRMMADTLWAVLEPVLQRLETRGKGTPGS